MNKIFFKFSLSFVLLINTLIFIIFFPHLILMVEKYLYPLFFIYFIIDSFSVILPKANESIYSAKMLESRYQEVPDYSEEKLRKKIKKNNYKAFLIFISYGSLIAIIGLLYNYFPWFNKNLLYLTFFAINFADYFCIMIWCPFRELFLKNSCCNTCRISNWDRIMKFSILVFIPNFFTITIFVLGSLIFIYWEYQHLKHPERFYRISNQTLCCKNCDKVTCGKKYKYKNKTE